MYVLKRKLGRGYVLAYGEDGFKITPHLNCALKFDSIARLLQFVSRRRDGHPYCGEYDIVVVEQQGWYEVRIVE